jgi:hypothetical protein
MHPRRLAGLDDLDRDHPGRFGGLNRDGMHRVIISPVPGGVGDGTPRRQGQGSAEQRKGEKPDPVEGHARTPENLNFYKSSSLFKNF